MSQTSPKRATRNAAGYKRKSTSSPRDAASANPFDDEYIDLAALRAERKLLMAELTELESSLDASRGQLERNEYFTTIEYPIPVKTKPRKTQQSRSKMKSSKKPRA